MRWSFRIGFAIFGLLAAYLPVSGRDAASALSRPISHFSVGNSSVLDALFWLGHDERVCFGIEFSGSDLNKDVQVEIDRSTVGEAVEKILGPSKAYQLSVADGVILIRKKGVNPPAWLDHVLPEFELPRMDVMWADTRLLMAFVMDLSPSQRGFAGDYPPTHANDEVGPFNERRQTVRQLINKIASESRGASWFLSAEGVRVSFPTAANHFWTFVTYSGQRAARPKQYPGTTNIPTSPPS